MTTCYGRGEKPSLTTTESRGYHIYMEKPNKNMPPLIMYVTKNRTKTRKDEINSKYTHSSGRIKETSNKAKQKNKL